MKNFRDKYFLSAAILTSSVIISGCFESSDSTPTSTTDQQPAASNVAELVLTVTSQPGSANQTALSWPLSDELVNYRVLIIPNDGSKPTEYFITANQTTISNALLNSSTVYIEGFTADKSSVFARVN